jgi:hypothetical protein
LTLFTPLILVPFSSKMMFELRTNSSNGDWTMGGDNINGSVRGEKLFCASTETKTEKDIMRSAPILFFIATTFTELSKSSVGYCLQQQ